VCSPRKKPNCAFWCGEAEDNEARERRTGGKGCASQGCSLDWKERCGISWDSMAVDILHFASW
jgi:hypothetical protein